MLFAKTNEIAAENIIKAFLELGVQENRIIFFNNTKTCLNKTYTE